MICTYISSQAKAALENMILLGELWIEA